MRSTDQRLAWALSVCERAHLRMTPVRRAILSFLASRRLPATLECIEQAEGVHGRCDATTVYRTLTLFKEADIARLVGMPRKTSHFMLNVPDEGGHYLVCRRCGRITELPLPPAVVQSVRHAAAAHGFASTPQDHEIHGLCDACQAARAKGITPSKLPV